MHVDEATETRYREIVISQLMAAATRNTSLGCQGEGRPPSSPSILMHIFFSSLAMDTIAVNRKLDLSALTQRIQLLCVQMPFRSVDSGQIKLSMHLIATNAGQKRGCSGRLLGLTHADESASGR